MEQVEIIGIDLAKRSFQLHGVNGGENMYRRGGVKLHQGLRR